MIQDLVDKNPCGNGQINSTNVNGPSFLDDPSGYLAQQTALLNSTISRQTGVSSSQFLPQQKPPTVASPTSTPVYNSQKSIHPTSPVVVHSSMTPTPHGGDCVSTSDAQQQQHVYKPQQSRHAFMHAEQQEDPAISSTFGDKFPSNSPRQQQHQQVCGLTQPLKMNMYHQV